LLAGVAQADEKQVGEVADTCDGISVTNAHSSDSSDSSDSSSQGERIIDTVDTATRQIVTIVSDLAAMSAMSTPNPEKKKGVFVQTKEKSGQTGALGSPTSTDAIVTNDHGSVHTLNEGSGDGDLSYDCSSECVSVGCSSSVFDDSKSWVGQEMLETEAEDLIRLKKRRGRKCKQLKAGIPTEKKRCFLRCYEPNWDTIRPESAENVIMCDLKPEDGDSVDEDISDKMGKWWVPESTDAMPKVIAVRPDSNTCPQLRICSCSRPAATALREGSAATNWIQERPADDPQADKKVIKCTPLKKTPNPVHITMAEGVNTVATVCGVGICCILM